MSTTFTLPSRAKVRSQSQRRYVLILESKYGAGIVKRSDRFDTLRTYRRREARFWPNASWFVGDRVDGTVTRLP